MKMYTVIALDLSKVQELAKDLDFVKQLRSQLNGGGKADLPGVTHLATAEQEHYKHLRLAVQRISTASAAQHSAGGGAGSRNGSSTGIELSYKKVTAEAFSGHEVAVLWFFLDRLDELEEHAEAFGSDLAKLCEAGQTFTPIPGGIYVGRVDADSPLVTELKSGELRSSKQEVEDPLQKKQAAPKAAEPAAEAEEPAPTV